MQTLRPCPACIQQDPRRTCVRISILRSTTPEIFNIHMPRLQPEVFGMIWSDILDCVSQKCPGWICSVLSLRTSSETLKSIEQTQVANDYELVRNELKRPQRFLTFRELRVLRSKSPRTAISEGPDFLLSFRVPAMSLTQKTSPLPFPASKVQPPTKHFENAAFCWCYSSRPFLPPVVL